ncbi:HCS2 neuropeptides-like [Gigantopelta aegis]|uniref:HCS2 neuropeptides-like n=1 Tax=Gigantopelta aegis TaxID=1735272 RepID=UPI001B88AD10|nr:HCS2 neuropeptides-like [Gigantopelta aegis]
MNEGVVLILFVLVGSSVAIFFTSSKQNDYPRIGRRSFYTSSKENTYPRIGRRSLENTYSKQTLPEKRAMYTTSNENSYPRIGRGVFTASGDGNSFPHIGRRKSSSDEGSDDEKSTSRNFFDDVTNRDTSRTPFHTQTISMNWDFNGDGVISRKEFLQGFLHGRKRRK